jgi:hypothetical protein
MVFFLVLEIAQKNQSDGMTAMLVSNYPITQLPNYPIQLPNYLHREKPPCSSFFDTPQDHQRFAGRSIST